MQKHSGTRRQAAAAVSHFPMQHVESLQRLGCRQWSSATKGVLCDDLWGGICTGTKYIMSVMSMTASCVLMLLTVAEQLN
jgi:hypothetical protein